MGTVNRFLCRVAGADLEILNAHPHEIVRHARIGAIIVMTALIATISMFFALETISGSNRVSLTGGLLWGCAIFLLDSFIVASYRKQDDKWKEFKVAFPRFLLALILGASISIPLELRVFENEITEKLKELNKAAELRNDGVEKKKYDNQIAPLNTEKENLLNDISQLNNQFLPFNTKINTLESDLSDEIGARGRTGKRGYGPMAKQIDAQLAIAREDKKIKSQELNPRIVSNNNRLKAIDSLIAGIKLNHGDKSDLKGISAQLDALKLLIKENNYVGWAYWIFLLLILGIETAPIFVKLFSPKGSYDETLAMNEYEVWINQQKRKSDLHEEINKSIQTSRAANKKSRETQEIINNEILREVASAQAEVTKHAIKKWKYSELLKVEQDVSEFIHTTTN